eukprot:symbB.v1.2.038992.t1/scaffold6282.1/size19416/1
MIPWLQTMVQPCLTCEPCRSESEPQKRRSKRTTLQKWMKCRQTFVPRPLPANTWHKVELVFSPLANMQGLLGYHSSVLVDGEEYYFTPSGIRCYPKLSSHKRMSERVEAGESLLGGTVLLDALSRHFQPRTYDLLRKNCNNFSVVKDICFEHDPRSGALCAKDACVKEHLDTLKEDAAKRFDQAKKAWQARSSKAKDSLLANHESSMQKPMEAVCSSTPLTCDLPLPPGLFEVPWYYDERWHQRAMSARMISSCTFLANSSLWSCMPRLRRYREIHPLQRPIFAAELGRLSGEMLHTAARPALLCIEKPYLEGFVDSFAETVTEDFILMAVNGGDAPLTLDQQRRIGKLPGLQACFAMNLHKAEDETCLQLA